MEADPALDQVVKLGGHRRQQTSDMLPIGSDDGLLFFRGQVELGVSEPVWREVLHSCTRLASTRVVEGDLMLPGTEAAAWSTASRRPRTDGRRKLSRAYPHERHRSTTAARKRQQNLTSVCVGRRSAA